MKNSPRFYASTRNKSDPLFYAADPWKDEDQAREPGWYLYTETWAEVMGPYANYQVAVENLKRYYSTL